MYTFQHEVLINHSSIRKGFPLQVINNYKYHFFYLLIALLCYSQYNHAQTADFSNDSINKCPPEIKSPRISYDTVSIENQDSQTLIKCLRGDILNGEQITLFTNNQDTAILSYYFMGYKHGVYQSFYPNGQLKIKSSYLLGELEGQFIRCYPDGTIAAKGRYQDGKPHGYWENFYPNGNLASQGKLILGKSDGEWSFYHPNGKLKQREFWKDLILISLSSFYTFNGEEKSIGNYKDGVGQRIHYRDDGSVKEDASYYNGLKQGRVQFFNSQEIRVAEYFYQRDTLHGPYFKYHLNGKLSESGFYVKGVLNGDFHIYDPLEVRQVKGEYINGKKDGIWYTYNSRGEPKSQITYQNNIQDGLALFFNDDGKIKSRGNFLKGVKEGEWYSYFSDESIYKIENYKSGKLSGKLTQYHKDGSLAIKGSYFQNKKNGEWEYYQFADVLDFLSTEDESRFLSTQKKKEKNNKTEVPLLKANYQNNLKEGVWVYKYPNGKTMLSETWKGNQLIQFSTQLLPNGKKCKSGKLVKGSGKRTFYDINGKKYLEGYYQNGIASGIWKYYDRKENLVNQSEMQGHVQTLIK